ncbi:MAG: LON peptidase substrate-binding domain-containing protein [Chloroflexi bacterium]|nr:LON peptidase substrate-binding domain-containing protein [Chloroflexota bacterium]
MKILHDDLPLFPLNAVLFPQARMPLQVFEPRYPEMIERCLRDDLAIGIVLIKEGAEVGGAAIPHSVGTIARIIDSARQDDGRINITATGVTRFVLQKYSTARAYLSGHIRLLPDENVDLQKIAPLAQRVGELFFAYVRAIQNVSNPEADDQEPAIELPKDPTILSYANATTMPVSAQDKQNLLETVTVPARLRREILILDREIKLLRLSTEQNVNVRDIGAFSAN